jgi:nitroimidazol reductase NimA-like FMN-containing flavoprotein (pyridoxamine 5'-phosphate oxidase superfamily)
MENGQKRQVRTIEGRTQLERLSSDECWQLLAQTPVGRIGIVIGGAPEIYPVNHVVDREAILFRTDPGTKLAGLAMRPSVCYQVDGYDPESRTGWSVLVKGRATQLHSVAERRRATTLPLDYWTSGTKPHWIRIQPSEVTGRRIWRRESVDR